VGVQYTVTTGKVSIAASVTNVVPISLACGATVAACLIGFDISFDSVATGAGAAPILVSVVRTSTVSSTTGAAYTPLAFNSLLHSAVTTARTGDTVGGTLVGTGVLKSWLVSPTSGLSYQWPLGREIDVPHSTFLEVRLTSIAGMTTCNYVASLDFEE
jgi:hypothetical protein